MAGIYNFVLPGYLQRSRVAPALLLAFLVSFPPTAWAADWAGLWLTPDQQGQRLFDQARYLEAAPLFENTARKGAAFFRGGDFESAAAVFGRMRGPQAAYNRGNALIMLGRYDEAIKSYQQALEEKPGWARAEENLAVAQARKERLAPPEDDAGGTGGMLEADEIVFDDSGRVKNSGSEEVTGGGDTLSENEMRATWLRRVQNDPADFLRTRFAYQLYREEQEGPDETVQ